MTAYATVAEVEAGFRDLDDSEESRATALLDEAALIIDQINAYASGDIKKLVSCRMVRRAIGDGGDSSIPIGATQGATSAMGWYSQSWQLSNGSSGELYVSKFEKQMLGAGRCIGMAQSLGDSDD
jgi:hypothetical protein